MKKTVTLFMAALLLVLGLVACSTASVSVEEIVKAGANQVAKESYEEAIKTYEEGLKTHPQSPELHKSLVESAFLLGDAEKGNKYLEQLNEIYEQSGDGEGLAWVTKMRSTSAEKVLNLTPEQRSYLNQLVEFAQKKDYEELYAALGKDSF